MKSRTLTEWLHHTQTIHALGVDLGLERVREVAIRLDLLKKPCPVITIGGTNGKGSCVAGLEAIYLAQGYRVGAFTTPYLYKHNEQVRIQGHAAEDDLFCKAFERIEAARGDITLTQFEFNTLAALDIFRVSKLDVAILEVGLGGRLDAVNIIDADVAVISSIDLDHIDWLGNTRELIALEKAGILRQGALAVCGDLHPPAELYNYAQELGVRLYRLGEDFTYTQEAKSWTWSAPQKHLNHLPMPRLALQNMATVLEVVELLQPRLPVTQTAILHALTEVNLPGRIQIIPGPVTRIIDVSHNPAATAYLHQQLQKMPIEGKTYAVFSMLADKDIVSSLKTIKDSIDAWYIAELPAARAASEEVLIDAFRLAKIPEVIVEDNIVKAYKAAMATAEPGDRVLIFGSFYTVAGVGEALEI